MEAEPTRAEASDGNHKGLTEDPKTAAKPASSAKAKKRSNRRRTHEDRAAEQEEGDENVPPNETAGHKTHNG